MGDQAEVADITRCHGRLMGDGGGGNRQVSRETWLSGLRRRDDEVAQSGHREQAAKNARAVRVEREDPLCRDNGVQPPGKLGRERTTLRDSGDAIFKLRHRERGDRKIRLGLRGEPCAHVRIWVRQSKLTQQVCVQNGCHRWPPG